MRLRTIRYFFKEAAVSLSRNRLLSLATATTVSVCILILGMALLLFVNSGQIMDKLESDVEIVAFLDNELVPYEKADIRDRIEGIRGVKTVVFVSKDEALVNIEKKMGEENLAETLEGNNPLPDSFKIKAKDPYEVDRIAKAVGKVDGVDKIRYGQALVQKLFAVGRWIRVISLFVVIFLGAAAVFLIATTIRLTIFSRRKEIYIMKLVGATDWFVMLPFFLEGMFLALVGTVFAVSILGFGYYYLVENLKVAMAFVPLVTDRQILTNMYAGLVVAGVCLGILGTSISINKFLDV
ncbi:MAG: permease-like cell division protein FtsX [Ignavibacteriales bacterium]